ncbi:MAG: SCO6880 family protein, partial [Microbacteriaceae bacterium]
MTVTPDYARTVRLPRRSRQGVVMGLDPWQVAFLAAAAVAVLIGVNRFGPLGLLYTAPIYLGFGVTALTSIHGVSTPKMAGLWLMKQVRHATGATTNVYRPERTQLAGTLNLPGTRASIQLWDVDGVAAVYNPHDRSVSVIAELEVQGFL